jgi:Transcription factor WhiB
MNNARSGQPVTPNDAINGPLTTGSPTDRVALMLGRFTDSALWGQVTRHARCADGGLDPDQWFPLSAEPGRARQEAAAAIAICTACPVRGHCLTISLQHWDIGQHGVWGGLIAADRARLRRRAVQHSSPG